MVKKFTIPCDFSGKKYPITFYVGNAAVGSHPIGFQSKWLSNERGGTVPEALMESLKKLKEISDRNKVDFEELCTYVIDEININNSKKKKALKQQETEKKRAEELKKKREIAQQQTENSPTDSSQDRS